MPSLPSKSTYLTTHLRALHFYSPRCIICTELYKENHSTEHHTPVQLSPCGHIFGQRCILEWFENRSTCPSCREVLLVAGWQQRRVVTDAAWEIRRERRDYEERRRERRADEQRDNLPRRSGLVSEYNAAEVYDENWIPRPPMGSGVLRYSLGSSEAARQQPCSSSNYSPSPGTARNAYSTNSRSGDGIATRTYQVANRRDESYHERTGLGHGRHYGGRYG